MIRRGMRHLAAVVVASTALPLSSQAQSATREACTQGELVACVRVDLTRAVQAGTTALDLTVSHLGVFTPLELMAQPSMVWFLAFSTGGTPAYSPDSYASLEAVGTAVLDDPTPAWTFADQGDLWGLFYDSAANPVLTTLGLGGSIPAGGDYLDGGGSLWRQIATTSADGGITFRVILPYLWDAPLADFQIAGLEAVSLTADYQGRELLAGSCSLDTACGSIPQTTVPEPSTGVLLIVGLLSLAHVSRRRALCRPSDPNLELT